MYINSIAHFRGIAILFIVAGHSMELSNYTYETILGKTIHNLTLGGTSFFVFISGFLFHHIFYKNFLFDKFIVTKIKHVLLPYIILSSIPIGYLLFKAFIFNFYTFTFISSPYETLYTFPFFRYYLTGYHGYSGYWYIPFIMLVFLMSPVFIRFIKLNITIQITSTIILFIFAVLIHRGTYENQFSIFQNVIYFSPLYLFGIIVSEKKEFIYVILKNKEYLLLALVIAFATIQAVSGKTGNYTKDPFTYAGIDFMMVQKMFFCLFLTIWLHRFEHYKTVIPTFISKHSFGIFFTHTIVISLLMTLKEKTNYSFISNLTANYSMVPLEVLLLSILATVLIKKVFLTRSKYIVGC